MVCKYCDIIQGKKKAAKIYEDYLLVAFLSEEPATIGHVVVIPKKHQVIFEEIEPTEAAYIFKVVNKLAIALFETLKIEGTNILIKNGVEAGQEVPHFSVNIIGRNASDGIALEWEPKQLTDQQMATIEMKLKEELASPTPSAAMAAPKVPEAAAEIGGEQGSEQTAGAGSAAEKSETAISTPKEKEESYLIKQLRRIP
ncbi:HIT domain-containing protein [Candidatus Woesearchaeota archaeon]|nr:HIT domain-containing protein [Candidatus Woesearchaeota archaeon]